MTVKQRELHIACEWGPGQERDKRKRKELEGGERKRRMGRRKEKRKKITKERKKGGGDGRGGRTEWTSPFESSQGVTALTYAFEIGAWRCLCSACLNRLLPGSLTSSHIHSSAAAVAVSTRRPQMRMMEYSLEEHCLGVRSASRLAHRQKHVSWSKLKPLSSSPAGTGANFKALLFLKKIMIKKPNT